MPKLTESIEARVPSGFANREWGTYMVRQFYEDRPLREPDVSDAFDGGSVTFEPEGEASTRITVELEMNPGPGSGAESDVMHARERVERVLKGHRTYVLRRCERQHCRTN